MLTKLQQADDKAGRLDNTLIRNYHDYLDKDKKLREDRRPEFEAFVYMVDRILTSVNANVNRYRAATRKTTNLSEVFSVSDEAFALLMVDNYWVRWHRLRHPKENKPKEWYAAQYTGSEEGRNESGFTRKGVQKYNDLVKMVQEKRREDRTGKDLEDYLRMYWRGQGEEVAPVSIPMVEGIVDLTAIFGNDADVAEVTRVEV